jgi:hypothetical protein
MILYSAWWHRESKKWSLFHTLWTVTLFRKLFGPVDPAPGIMKTIEFYRDMVPGSIPYAVVDDSAAAQRVASKSDVLIYTAACRDWVAKVTKKRRQIILIRFVPDQEAINKIRMLVNRKKGYWGKSVSQ